MNHETEIQRLESLLARYRARIETLQDEADRAPSKLREDLARELSEIHRRQRHAEEHLAQVRLRHAESWEEEDFATGLMAIFDDLGRRIDGLFGRIA